MRTGYFLDSSRPDGELTNMTAATSGGSKELLRLAKVGQELDKQLQRFGSAFEDYLNAQPDLELPTTEAMTDARESLRAELASALEVMRLIDSGVSVAATTPRGNFWTTPLTINQAFRLMEQASPDSLGFRIQADSNYAKHVARSYRQHAAASSTCGRGNNCQTRTVTWPGRTRGPACWRHLTPEEREELTKLYDLAVENRPCEACQSSPGEPCDENAEPKNIDGWFSPIRQFNKRSVHLIRLEASVA